MSYDGATFSQHSVLSPPLLAAIDSQHIFGSYDGPSTARAAADASSSASHAQSSTSSHHRRTRSRASSAASVHNIVANANTAISSLQQNGNTSNHRRPRRGHHAQSGHSRSSSGSGPLPAPARSGTFNVYSSSATFDEPRPLTSSLRNRSTPHLEGLRSLSSANEHSHTPGGASAFTAPSSPLLSAATSMALAMSPVAQASALADHLMPSEWTLDSSSVPTSPHTNSLSRTASDYFDPVLFAQLQSQNNSSHPELRSRPGDPSPPIDTVFGRLSPHPSHAARSASQSEWAQHAAHAHLLGLQRLFASRSTPHLPDLDSTYLVGHEFESPPPYAPRASATETELERAADLTSPPGLPSSSSSHSTLNNASTTSLHDPPLPPPIAIPTAGVNGHAISGPSSATVRPGLRARSSSRGSRSGPPSPSASFYGRRGLTSLSPFPAGLEMTPSVTHVSQFSTTPASPGGFAPDSDGDEDHDGVVTFSSSRSKQRRDGRRGTVGSMDNGSRVDISNGPISASLPGSSAQAQAILSRRRRSGSAGSARQLLRPRTPINPTVEPQYAADGSAQVSRENLIAPSPVRGAVTVPENTSFTPSNGSGPSNRRTDGLTSRSGSRAAHTTEVNRRDDIDDASPPISPTSDSTHPSSPLSPDDAASTMSPSSPLTHVPTARSANEVSSAKTSANAAAEENEEDEEFPLVLKLLLHPLRILAAVPGCIGTFWLARNAFILATSPDYHLLSPGHLVHTSSGTSHFLSTSPSPSTSTSTSSTPYLSADPLRLGRRQPGALDFAIACLWSMSTAYHALSFTTLLLRRWLLYYSILPSLIRLVALQAICWPLVRLTVHVFGVDQPLGAWVVIGTTTALSDVVSRWVTSNIADAPLDDELDEEEESSDEAVALGYISDNRFAKSPTRPTPAAAAAAARGGGGGLFNNAEGAESDWDPKSGDESDAAAANFYATEKERQRKQRRGGQGTRFWRAVIGGPSFANSRRKKSTKVNNVVDGMETEVEGESDWPGYGTDRTVLGGGGVGARLGFSSSYSSEGLRRRFGPGGGAHLHPPSATSSTLKEATEGSRRTVLPPPPSNPTFSTYTYTRQSGHHTRFVYKDGTWQRERERTSSRRNFHWEVAVWRNVVPIAVLAYLSMWVLIADAMRLGG